MEAIEFTGKDLRALLAELPRPDEAYAERVMESLRDQPLLPGDLWVDEPR